MFVRISTANRTARLALAFVCATTTAASARAGFTVFSAGGTSAPASIQPTVDAFRAALGDPNNGNNPGPLGSGRREINWDGGGATTAAVSGSTLSAFTNTRGATFTTPGTGFLQTPLNVAELTGIQPSYETTFNTFSPVRIFTPTGSNVTDVTFSLPGSGGATPATVSAFGAVFADVDLTNTTTIELFDLANASLLLLNVPPRTSVDAPVGLSFAGAAADAGEQIARVRITTGNQALGLPDSNGNPVDVVVMDDFIYAEPQAVPEPGAGLLAAISALAASALRRRGD